MKKITALFLALVMVMSLAACSGVQKGTNGGKNGTWEMPSAGVTMVVPDILKNLKGTAVAYDGGAIDYNGDVVYWELQYFTLPRETYDDLMSKEEVTDEEETMFYDAYHSIFYVFGIKNGGTAQLEIYLAEYDVPTDQLEEIGTAGDFTFFYDPTADGDAEDLGEYAEEYETIIAGKEEYIANMTFAEPEDQYTVTESGSEVAFETTDLDGNPVNMSEIFAQHDVTMINIWATWCGPCVNEMPELADLDREWADKNCAIVGILMDDTDEETLDDAKEILENTGVDFTVVIAPENFEEIITVQAFPTSYFVDKQGKIIGDPIIGAYTDVYPEKLDEALKEAKR